MGQSTSTNNKNQRWKSRYTYKPRTNASVSIEEATPYLEERLAKLAVKAVRVKSVFANAFENRVQEPVPLISENDRKDEVEEVTVLDKDVESQIVKNREEGNVHTVTDELHPKAVADHSVSKKEERKDGNYDSALKKIKKLCVSEEDFCPATKVRIVSGDGAPVKADKESEDRMRPLKCTACGSNVRLVNKFRPDALWKVECRSTRCLKTIAFVPYDADYAKKLNDLYEVSQRKSNSRARRSKAHVLREDESSSFSSDDESSDDEWAEEINVNGDILVSCPGQKEKVILF